MYQYVTSASICILIWTSICAVTLILESPCLILSPLSPSSSRLQLASMTLQELVEDLQMSRYPLSVLWSNKHFISAFPKYLPPRFFLRCSSVCCTFKFIFSCIELYVVVVWDFTSFPWREKISNTLNRMYHIIIQAIRCARFICFYNVAYHHSFTGATKQMLPSTCSLTIPLSGDLLCKWMRARITPVSYPLL